MSFNFQGHGISERNIVLGLNMAESRVSTEATNSIFMYKIFIFSSRSSVLTNIYLLDKWSLLSLVGIHY